MTSPASTPTSPSSRPSSARELRRAQVRTTVATHPPSPDRRIMQAEPQDNEPQAQTTWKRGTLGAVTGPGAPRTLRPLSPPPSLPSDPPPPTVTSQTAKQAQLFALAAEMNYFLVPYDNLVKELGRAVGKRMAARRSQHVYQLIDFSLAGFPLAVVEQLFDPAIKFSEHQWKWNTFEELSEAFHPILSQCTSSSAGATKALKSKSERVVRVVASLVPPVTISYTKREGMDKLSVNAYYILADEDGEIHPPKDQNRNEIQMSAQTMTKLRQQLLADVLRLHQSGAPLSPGFLRQLGLTDKAMELEAYLINAAAQRAQPAPAAATVREDWFNVEAILEVRGKRCLVLWEGYHPSYERWRRPDSGLARVESQPRGGNSMVVRSSPLATLASSEPRPRSPRPRGGCQKQECAAEVRRLKEEIHSLRAAAEKQKEATCELRLELNQVKKTLNAERATRHEQIKGELRALDAQRLEKVRERDEYEREARKQAADRKYFAKLADRLASELQSEKCKLMEKVAQLTTQVGKLRSQIATTAKKEIAQARVRAKEDGAWKRAQTIKEQQLEIREAGIKEAQTRAEAREVEINEAQARAEEADARARESQSEAEQARLDCVREAELCREAEQAAKQEVEAARYALLLAQAREERAKKKAMDVANSRLAQPPANRTDAEWAALSRQAAWKAAQRDRDYLEGFFTSRKWRMVDLAAVLGKLGLLSDLFATPPLFALHYNRVQELMKALEKEHFGAEFGLFLRYELHLTLPKILLLSQAASKKYSHTIDRYIPKALLYDPYHKKDGRSLFIKVPRISPSATKLTPIIRDLEAKIGVEAGEDGRIAFKSFAVVVQELIARDPGCHMMPAISSFLGGALELPIVISFDATGFGAQQLTTVATRNPYFPQSAQLLRLFGLGNVGDDRSGMKRLLGPNLATINDLLTREECTNFNIPGQPAPINIKPRIYSVLDVSALRHTEHLANSGWCGCSRDFALRDTPKKPSSVHEMHEFLKKCKSPSVLERFVLSHNPIPGEEDPRPCPACEFGHNRATVSKEYDDLLKEEAELAAGTTKAAVARFSKWRMRHAHDHFNVQPGVYGRPFMHVDLKYQILDALHLGILGLPKTPWKHAILNNASDDARVAISDLLKSWKHPLDTRRKDDGRSRAQKWFTGEAWASFCAGERGSPGGPIALAHIVLLIAEDMQQRGVDLGAGAAGDEPVEQGAAPKPAEASKNANKGGRKAKMAAEAALALAAGDAAQDTQLAVRAGLEHKPTAVEEAADPADLDIIRSMFGSRAQTIINALLAFDAYFAWYYPFKGSIELYCDTETKENHALKIVRAAVDMNEIFERITIRKHGSFLVHGAMYKVIKDILLVGDVWAFSLSALELQNAETKRTGTVGGSRRLTVSTSGQMRVPMRGVSEGPATLVKTKGYSTSMSLSVLKNLLVTKRLRDGDGLQTRRAERVFGERGTGRLALCSHGVKLEHLGGEYSPKEDTCVKAFVRLLATKANEQISGSDTQ